MLLAICCCRNETLRVIGLVGEPPPMLIDVTDQRQARLLQAQAERCLRLSGAAGDAEVNATLNRLAHEYSAKALALESRFRRNSLRTSGR